MALDIQHSTSRLESCILSYGILDSVFQYNPICSFQWGLVSKEENTFVPLSKEVQLAPSVPPWSVSYFGISPGKNQSPVLSPPNSRGWISSPPSKSSETPWLSWLQWGRSNSTLLCHPHERSLWISTADRFFHLLVGLAYMVHISLLSVWYMKPIVLFLAFQVSAETQW